MKPIVITLPLPPKELSPNCKPISRGAALKKGRIVKEYRTRCGFEAIAVCSSRPKFAKVAVQPTFFYPTNRNRDGDNSNASIKNAIDGALADAEIVRNDSGVTLLPPIFSIDKDRPRVELSIVEIKEPAPSLTAAPRTVTRRLCSKCGLSMSRSVHPTRVVCTPCGRSVDVGVDEAKQYPWE